MTIEEEAERDDLRALLKFPQIGLLAYSADPIVQRRFGRVLAETSTLFPDEVFSTHNPLVVENTSRIKNLGRASDSTQSERAPVDGLRISQLRRIPSPPPLRP
jgi:hypothetical protein